jgi:hypothetical protein
MTLERLIRWAGLVSVAAAVLIIVSQLMGLYAIDPNDLIGTVNSVPATIFNMLKLFAFVLLLVGLVGLYARQSVEAGALGLIGFLVAFLGTTLVAGDWWYEGLAVPWLAAAAPQVLEEAASGSVDAFRSVQAGSLTSFVLFALGWVLFGIATLRARIFPRWIALVVIVGGAIGFLGGFPPFMVVLALGVGCMGYWLYTRGGVPQQVAKEEVGHAHRPERERV